MCDTDAIDTCEVLKDVSLDDAREMVVMALAVYSRVGSMLQAAGVDLAALREEIAARYGLTIDLRTLAALAQDGRVQRPDIEVLEAVALILGVRVDDLLDVRAMKPAEAASVVSDDILLDAERDALIWQSLGSLIEPDNQVRLKPVFTAFGFTVI